MYRQRKRVVKRYQGHDIVLNHQRIVAQQFLHIYYENINGLLVNDASILPK